jgi:hypothetical protein
MSAKPEQEITYGWLPPEDWPLLEPVFEQYGTPMPVPLLGNAILVAVKEGVIVGFQVRQLLWHVEPLYVVPELQGSNVWRDLAGKVEESFHGAGSTAFYSFCDDDKTAHMLREFGCEEIVGRRVFIKKIEE